MKEYKGYEIDTTTYSQISVFYQGDDLIFETEAEAMQFIDSVTAEQD